MISRSVVILLVLFIGSPTCWCCFAHEPAPVSASCCHQEFPANDTPRHPDCPCATDHFQRDIVDGRVLLPDAGALVLPMPVVTSVPVPFMPAPLRPLTWEEHGPPQSAARLFQRHCAWLL